MVGSFTRESPLTSYKTHTPSCLLECLAPTTHLQMSVTCLAGINVGEARMLKKNSLPIPACTHAKHAARGLKILTLCQALRVLLTRVLLISFTFWRSRPALTLC